MGSNPVGALKIFLGFICNCLSYFTTAKISFTCTYFAVKHILLTTVEWWTIEEKQEDRETSFYQGQTDQASYRQSDVWTPGQQDLDWQCHLQGNKCSAVVAHRTASGHAYYHVHHFHRNCYHGHHSQLWTTRWNIFRYVGFFFLIVLFRRWLAGQAIPVTWLVLTVQQHKWQYWLQTKSRKKKLTAKWNNVCYLHQYTTPTASAVVCSLDMSYSHPDTMERSLPDYPRPVGKERWEKY